MDSYTQGHLHKTLFFSTPIQTLYFYIPISGQLMLWTPFFVSQWCLLTRASTIQVLSIVKMWIFKCGKPESFTHHDEPLLGNWFYLAKLWHTLLQELLHLWAKFPVHFHQARSVVQFLDLLFLSLFQQKKNQFIHEHGCRLDGNLAEGQVGT